jgi:hypothetical protein
MQQHDSFGFHPQASAEWVTGGGCVDYQARRGRDHAGLLYVIRRMWGGSAMSSHGEQATGLGQLPFDRVRCAHGELTWSCRGTRAWVGICSSKLRSRTLHRAGH